MLKYHVIFKLSKMFENIMNRNTKFIILYCVWMTLNIKAELS